MYFIGHTPKNTSGRNTKGQIAEELSTTGVYSICRHPLYAGNFLMWLGIAMMTESVAFIVMFCLAFWLYYERIMIAEEQFLRKFFSMAYLIWAEKTPAFIPNLKDWKKAQRTSHLKM
jgi:protein-S-isoprenylcysteine O-methyltransferase Ste14